jgi:hypothetical protein
MNIWEKKLLLLVSLLMLCTSCMKNTILNLNLNDLIAYTPTSIAFNDLDPRVGKIKGTIIISRAKDESIIDSYLLYWGSSEKTKLSFIG